MLTILEPVGAGVLVAIINKFIINNHSLWARLSCLQPSHLDEHDDEDNVSSTSTTTVESIEVHAHF